jgi:hypothetical protein
MAYFTVLYLLSRNPSMPLFFIHKGSVELTLAELDLKICYKRVLGSLLDIYNFTTSVV